MLETFLFTSQLPVWATARVSYNTTQDIYLDIFLNSIKDIFFSVIGTAL